MPETVQRGIDEAARAIAEAQTLIITSGAGMGVDSGLPDFRGPQGFWKAYPMYENLGLGFTDAANPLHFRQDPPFGWGFYGHRTELYRRTIPHQGFELLRHWISSRGLEAFVVTSNVDGQFQKAGFDESRILEVHGSIHHLQCTAPCEERIWPNEEDFQIDLKSMRSRTLPHCRCGLVARPNILMFADSSWVSGRTDTQQRRLEAFIEGQRGARQVVLEMGAGTSVPTIRWMSEQLSKVSSSSLVRINPRENEVPPGQIRLPLRALDALDRIDRAMARL